MPEADEDVTMPTSENSFAVSCELSFEDGTQPVPYKVDEPDIYEFTNMKLLVTLGDETREYSVVVKKEADKFILGTIVFVPSGNIKDYAKVDKITLRAIGYNDVVFMDMPINENFVNLPVVVIKK